MGAYNLLLKVLYDEFWLWIHSFLAQSSQRRSRDRRCDWTALRILQISDARARALDRNALCEGGNSTSQLTVLEESANLTYNCRPAMQSLQLSSSVSAA